MQQVPQFIAGTVPLQQQYASMPYYYPMIPMQAGMQPTGMMMPPNGMMMNINPQLSSQIGIQQDQFKNNGGDKRRAQSQSEISFDDILDREKFKFESAKNNNRKGDFFQNQQQQNQLQVAQNIFKPGNHNNHFNPKSMTDILQDKQKKNQYAQLLNQQLKIKKDLDEEKKVLDTKHNIHLYFERQKNDIKSYNMPLRDTYGNILQTRGQPGNKNYQVQDWFTHVPNINRKYAQEDDIQLVDQVNNDLRENIQNPHQREFNAFQRQQQALLNFENRNKRNIQFNLSNDIGQQQQSLVINQNQNQNNERSYSQQQNNQQQQQQHHNNSQSNVDNLSYPNHNDNYDDNGGDGDDDDNRRVRILTPTKYRRTAKGTQTPHNQEELNQLTNQEIGDLYPSLIKSQNDLSYVPHPPPPSQSQQRLQTNSTRLPSALSFIPNSSVRFTQYLKGDFKYANDIDKMRKREQYIQLQNEQINQMEEKKRQKELQKIQERRDRDLDDLRVSREAQDITDKFIYETQGNPFDHKNLRESYVADNPSIRFSTRKKNDSTFSNFEVQHVTSSSHKKGKRPRTPLEDAFNPFEKTDKSPKSSTHHEKHIIIQEIPMKVREKVGEAVNEELAKLRSELRVSQGFVQNELQSIKSNLSQFNQQKQDQEHEQNILATEINKTRLVDEIRRRELEQKYKDKERNEQEEIDAELAQTLLANPGYARYDLQNQKKVFFDYDDQYAFNPERINSEIGSILRGGELPSQKLLINYNNGGINNRSNFLTYDDGFAKSSQEILSNQQMKIEDRLNKMGLNNLEQSKSPSLIFQNYSTAADIQSDGNYKKSFKTGSLTEINRQSAANSEIDDIYSDLIKGNKENSKLFKNKRDNDQNEIDDFIMWNSKNIRYR